LDYSPTHQTREPDDQDWLDLEYYKCATDPLYWIQHYGWIRDERTGDVFGPGIDLWAGHNGAPGQYEYAELIASGESVITGKSRQVGASWIPANLEVHAVMFETNVAQGIVAPRDEDVGGAIWHLARSKWIYDQQPEHLKRAQPVFNNQHTLLLDNGSSITAAVDPRGLAAKRIRCEEMAHWKTPPPKDRWAAIIGATNDNGGQVLVVSTANGEGNLYHELWTKAESGENNLRTVFFPWHIHPVRRSDPNWYDNTVRKLGPELTRQEYPATPGEMFIFSGTKYFEQERLVLFDAQGKQLEAGAVNEPLPDYPHGWSVYVERQEGRRYTIGIDTANGGGDACSADVIDVESGLQVAHIHSAQWGFDRFADEVYDAANLYNGAFLVPEQNNHGHALILQLTQHKGYNRLYRYEDYDVVKRTGVQRLGWNNTSKTRPEALGKLKLAIRDMAIKPMHLPTINEMRAFEYNSSQRAEAKEGMHDDRVFSLTLGNIGREHVIGHVDDNFVMVL
jgi:hypothetical protein